MRALLLRVALFLPVLCVCNPLQNSFVERDGHDGEANAGNATGTSSQPTDWDQKASAQDGDDAADTGVSQAENVVKVVQQLHYGSGGAPPSASETAQFLVDVPSGTFSIVHDTPRLLNASLDTNELSCETDGGTVEVPAGATVSIPAHANGDPTHCQLTFATSAAGPGFAGAVLLANVIPPADSDGDGIPDLVDRCPDTPAGVQVDPNGCARTNVLDDGGVEYCNDPDSCFAGVAAFCSHGCSIVTPHGTRFSCPGDAGCSESLGAGGSCSDCTATSGGFDVDCSGGHCDDHEGGALACTGGPGDCVTMGPGGYADSCPPGIDCTTILDPSTVGADAFVPVVVRTATSGSDGSFEFGVGGPGSDPSTATYTHSIPTSGGVGTEELHVLFGADPGASDQGHVFETQQTGWDPPQIDCGAAPGSTVGGNSFVFSGAGGDCLFTNPRIATGSVLPSPVTNPDGISSSRTFGLPPGHHVVVAGAGGLVILDPLTGQIPRAGHATLLFTSYPYQNLLGALVLETPLGDGSDVLLTYGSAGSGTLESYVPENSDFGAIQLFFGTYSDAIQLGADPAQTEGLLVGNATVSRLGWIDYGTGTLFPGTTHTDVDSSAFVGLGAPVSAFAFPSPTRIVAVTGGTPGKLVLGDPANPFSAVVQVGDVGNDPRRVRCLGGVCAVSNFGSDSLSIAAWDGGTNAQLTATQAVGDGPVGISLRMRGSNVLIASTGFNDSTYTLTEVTPAGAVVGSTTQPAPAGCDSPAHALWLDDPEEILVLSCYASDALAVIHTSP